MNIRDWGEGGGEREGREEERGEGEREGGGRERGGERREARSGVLIKPRNQEKIFTRPLTRSWRLVP